MQTRLTAGNWETTILKTIAVVCTATLFLLCQFSWAGDEFDIAIELRQQGNFNLSIKQLRVLHQSSPQDLKITVELAATYYMAGYFREGSKLFKQILQGEKTSDNIKVNVTEFVNQYSAAIKEQQLLNERLLSIRRLNISSDLKIEKLSTLLAGEPDYTAAKIVRIHLYLVGHNYGEAKRQLASIHLQQLSPEDELRIQGLSKRYRFHAEPRSIVGFSGSLFFGNDDNITGGSGGDLIDDIYGDGFDEEFDTEDFNPENDEDEEYDEDYGHDFDDDFEDDIDEEYDEESEDDDFDFEEGDFEEDELEDDEFDEDGFGEGSDSESGLFNLINGRVDYSRTVPYLDNGTLVKIREYGLHLNFSERRFSDDVAEGRNYGVWDIGGTVGTRFINGARLRFPFSLKKIRLNDSDYAMHYEAKVAYYFRRNRTSFSIIEKLSYRDYASFDDDRENGLLLETRGGVRHYLNDDLALNAGFSYGVLNTWNEDYRSYNRYGFSSSVSYRSSRRLSVVAGAKYQLTDYLGVNELFVDEYSDPVYDFSRRDNQLSLYGEIQIKLNSNWGMKMKMSHTDRQSNQERYQYDRSTVSVGVTTRF